MPTFQTAQEEFWAGQFGDEYIGRNADIDQIASNTAFFSSVLDKTAKFQSVFELGANIGLNLRAIKSLCPHASFSALEINQKAVSHLKELGWVNVHHNSILEFETTEQYDFVFIKGVLIHLNPEALPKVYDLMHTTSSKYICIAEYYNPTPVEINYRGHSDKLFKRDFAGEVLDRFPDLTLLDYGFAYHRDSHFPQDDITWFLMEKKS